VADVEDEAVGRRIENGMERDGQLDHAEVGPEMAARLGQDGDELLPDFLRQRRQLRKRKLFDVGR
jgi:hypothetical protein